MHLLVPKHIQNVSQFLRSSTVCLVTPLIAVLCFNEGKEQKRRTKQKFVNKHLLGHGLLSLEINGVLNKLLPLEQCQCQREFVVKEKLHTSTGKLPSHYCLYLT